MLFAIKVLWNGYYREAALVVQCKSKIETTRLTYFDTQIIHNSEIKI